MAVPRMGFNGVPAMGGGGGGADVAAWLQVLINRGYRMIMAGGNAIAIWRGMKKAADFLGAKLKTLSR